VNNSYNKFKNFSTQKDIVQDSIQISKKIIRKTLRKT